METKIAYQYDVAGMYQGAVEADPSPLEPGVFLLPGRCTFSAPPDDIPEGRWPRWNGVGWVLVRRRAAPAAGGPDPIDKLREFLNSNPDVAKLLDPE